MREKKSENLKCAKVVDRKVENITLVDIKLFGNTKKTLVLYFRKDKEVKNV